MHRSSLADRHEQAMVGRIAALPEGESGGDESGDGSPTEKIQKLQTSRVNKGSGWCILNCDREPKMEIPAYPKPMLLSKVLLIGVLAAVAASAVPITYTFSIVTSGTIGSTPFTNQTLTFSVTT